MLAEMARNDLNILPLTSATWKTVTSATIGYLTSANLGTMAIGSGFEVPRFEVQKYMFQYQHVQTGLKSRCLKHVLLHYSNISTSNLGTIAIAIAMGEVWSADVWLMQKYMFQTSTADLRTGIANLLVCLYAPFFLLFLNITWTTLIQDFLLLSMPISALLF